MVVYMNKCDLVDDEELLDLVEMEVLTPTHAHTHNAHPPAHARGIPAHDVLVCVGARPAVVQQIPR